MARKSPFKDREPDYPFLFQAQDWELSYLFSVMRMRDKPEPFWEYRAVEIKGVLLLPALKNVTSAIVRLNPDARYDEANWSNWREPSTVGFSSIEKGVYEARVSLPREMLAPVLTALAAGKIRYVTLDGTKLRYHRGEIRGYSFYQDVDQEYTDELLGIWKR